MKVVVLNNASIISIDILIILILLLTILIVCLTLLTFCIIIKLILDLVNYIWLGRGCCL
jgi:hypothetical protein